MFEHASQARCADRTGFTERAYVTARSLLPVTSDHGAVNSRRAGVADVNENFSSLFFVWCPALWTTKRAVVSDHVCGSRHDCVHGTVVLTPRRSNRRGGADPNFAKLLRFTRRLPRVQLCLRRSRQFLLWQTCSLRLQTGPSQRTTHTRTFIFIISSQQQQNK